jgi:hypothetical protein
MVFVVVMDHRRQWVFGFVIADLQWLSLRRGER